MDLIFNCPGTDKSGKRLPGNLLDRTQENDFWIYFNNWLKKANVAASGGPDEPPSYFSALIYLWVVFNGWLGKVVKDHENAESDAKLVNAAARDVELNRLFDTLITNHLQFKMIAHRFRDLFPIFQALTIRDFKLPPWDDAIRNRHDYRRAVFVEEEKRFGSLTADKEAKKGSPLTDGEGTKLLKLLDRDFAPLCCCRHQTDPADFQTFDASRVPLDWPHVLSGIYKVRCNLFHGGKSVFYGGDALFVELAYRILWEVWGQPAFDAHT